MLNIGVCIGSSCHLKGAYNVIQEFQHLIEEHSLHDKIEMKANFCVKQCDKNGVSIKIEEMNYNILPENAKEFFDNTILSKLKTF